MNTACVEHGGRMCVLMSFYRPQEGRGAFRGTLARWDTPDGWARKIEGLNFLGPAKGLTFADLGVEGEIGGPKIFDHGKPVTVLAFRLKMERLLKRACDRRMFEERNLRYGTSLHFETEFEDGGLFEIEDDKWRFAERKPVVKRKPKRIIY